MQLVASSLVEQGGDDFGDECFVAHRHCSSYLVETNCLTKYSILILGCLDTNQSHFFETYLATGVTLHAAHELS
jgi:hypothetical protein